MYLYYDLYTNKAFKMPEEEAVEAIKGLESVSGDNGITSWNGETYLVVKVEGDG